MVMRLDNKSNRNEGKAMTTQRSTSHTRQPKRTFLSRFYITVLAALAITIVPLFACGGSEDSPYGYPGQPGASSQLGAPGEPGAPGEASSVRAKLGLDDSLIPRPAATVVVVREVAVESEVMKAVEAMPAATALPVAAMERVEAEEEFGESVDISFQPQTRMIVRNADMIVQSNDPVSAIDLISDIAVRQGGWVVNSNSSDRGFYSITIRVPADVLDTVIEQISAIADKVESVTSDSTDFTEEYIDLGARRATIQETVDALTAFLQNENYDNVEALLEVQREITYWQSELEVIDGRMSFISESAAFSRLSVTVNQSPIPIRVDVGEDVHVGIGVGNKYTARFFPPEGYDRFEIVWDFGDGSSPQTVYSGLRTQGEDGFLSVPVRHTFMSDELSPHVVSANVKAYSDRGLAEGEDQLWANVSELPRIDAFISSEERVVEQGETVTFTASFNHPETLRDVEYTWDFRDGSEVISGTVQAGDTGIEVEHAFERHRPEPYIVVFEIQGDSDAGEVKETHEMYISVDPAPSVESSDFDAGGTATDAVNVLIGVFTFAGTAGIWLAITSPIWLILGAVIFFVVRFIRRRQRNVRRVVYVPNDEAVSEEEQTDNDDVPQSPR